MNENKQKILGLMGIATKAGKIVFGTDACIEAIEREKVHFLVIAGDASERTKHNFISLCDKKHVSYAVFDTIDEISKAIGKKNKAVIGIKDSNLAKEIAKKFDGGDSIG